MIVGILLAVIWTAEASAAIIDFETVPGGTPRDRLDISTQYAAEFGVSFGLDANGDRIPDNNQFPDPGKERGA